jgi:hypothetical protein
VELGASSAGLVGVKNGHGQSTTNASPRDHIQQKTLAPIELSALDQSAMHLSTQCVGI